MTDSFPLDIQFGHLGEPNYNHELRTWEFARKAVSEPRLRPLGHIRRILDGSAAAQGESTNAAHGAHFRSSRSILSKLELSLASNFGKPYLDETSSDPARLCGDVHVYVNAKSRTRLKKVGMVPILATVAGPCAEILRLTILSTQELGRFNAKGRTIAQPTAERGESCFWTEPGGTILQICPSTKSNGELGEFLAIRRKTHVAILRLSLSSRPTSLQSQSQFASLLPASRISVHQLCKCEQRDIPSGPVLDMTFNPWNEHQFAFIDAEDKWWIWEFSLSSRERDVWTKEVLSCGTIQQKDADSSQTRRAQPLWAKLLWAVDHHVLVVAKRDVFTAIHLLDSARPLRLEGLVLEQPDDQMLDIRRGPHDSRILFVLTTLKILVIKIEWTDSPAVEAGEQLKATKVLSWIHDRNPIDLTLGLQFHHFELSEHRTCNILMIHSRANIPVSIYTFELNTETGRWTSGVDPYSMLLTADDPSEEGTSASSTRAAPMLGLNLSTLLTGQCAGKALGRLNEDEDAELVQLYSDLGVNLFQLRILYADGSVCEGLLYSVDVGQVGEVEEPQIIKPPHVTQAPLRIERDPFVVDDSLSQLLIERSLPGAASNVQSLDRIVDDPRTLDFTWLIEQLKCMQSSHSHATTARSHTEAMRLALAAFEGAQSNELKTLSESLHLDTSADSLRHIGDQIQGLIQPYLVDNSVEDSAMNESAEGNAVIRKAMFSAYPQDVALAPSGLDNLHLQLNESIALDLQVSSHHGRQAADDLVKKVAVDTYLASYTIGRPSIAVRGTIASNQEYTTEDSHPDEDQSSQRLRSLTDLAAQPVLPTKLDRLLDRWTIGTDPDDVDWALATQQILSADVDTEAQVPESTRKKKAKRKRRLEALAQGAFDNKASVEDLGVGGSQPLPFRQTGDQFLASSSQVSASQDNGLPMVLSQPERGLHGKRPSEKQKKKRKRTEGF